MTASGQTPPQPALIFFVLQRGDERASDVVFDISANILKPVDDGQYVVLVSAYPAEPTTQLEAYPHLSCPVLSLAQARERRFEMIDQMKSDLVRRGHAIREVRMKG